MTFQYDETGKRVKGEYRLNSTKLYAILETINSNHFTDITLSERAINIYGILDISADCKEEGCQLGELMSKREVLICYI